MMDEGLQLPCENCGKLIDYDGVSAAGANTVCEHCGSKNPHTLRGNPLLPFLFFFIGVLTFGLINPFNWSDDALFFGAFGSFCLLIWLTLFLPGHIAQLKGQTHGSCAVGCFSFLLLGFVGLSFLMFAAEMSSSSRHRTKTYYGIGGYEITSGIDSVPKSKPRGKVNVIRFSNELTISIRLHRFDHEGNMHFDHKLVPRQGSRDLDTFGGETWVVTDLDATPLYYYIAEPKASFAFIPPGWEPN